MLYSLCSVGLSRSLLFCCFLHYISFYFVAFDVAFRVFFIVIFYATHEKQKQGNKFVRVETYRHQLP